MSSKQTPSQTVGPYFAYGLTGDQYGYQLTGIANQTLTRSDTAGQHIRIEGHVFDGAGVPINDALIEIWQADPQGRYAHPADARAPNTSFKGFGRCGTGADPGSQFYFDTLKPGSVDGVQAPHINVIIMMRGMLTHAYTRIYFSDEAAANAADPVLATISANRRDTLIAKRANAPSGSIYRFDIHMQGEQETVFFDA